MIGKSSRIRWVVPLVSCAALIVAAGLAKVIGQAPAPVFIAGDQPVTEDQVRNKLLTEGWVNVQTARDGQFIRATGMHEGQPQKVIVNAGNGRLRSQVDDDDDD